MRILTFADFAGKLGKTYEILAGGGSLPVTLAEAQDLPGSARQGGAFRLVFLGPFEPVLPQGIYAVRRGTETHQIFIVPIGRTQAGTQYEAIFG